MRLRVTWICLEWPNDNWHTGGVARHSFRMAEAVKNLIDLTVISFEGAKQIDGVAFQCIKPASGRLGRYYVSPAKIPRIVRESKPDVVHAHGDDWFLQRRYPIVRTFYGLSVSEARSSRGLRKWNHYVLAILEKRSARRSDVKLAIAPESMTAFKCDHLCPPVGNDVKSSTVTKSEVPSAIYIGSFEGRKRGWFVQQALQVVRGEFADLVLTVVGPEEDRERWQDWVNYRTGLTDDEVADEIARSWVLLAPSKYEGFGLPAFEALEVGTRVLASSNPGSRYLSGVGGEDLPLRVVTDTDFTSEIRSVFSGSSPVLQTGQSEACRRLSLRIREWSSADAIVRIYRAAFATRA